MRARDVSYRHERMCCATRAQPRPSPSWLLLNDVQPNALPLPTSVLSCFDPITHHVYNAVNRPAGKLVEARMIWRVVPIRDYTIIST